MRKIIVKKVPYVKNIPDVFRNVYYLDNYEYMNIFTTNNKYELILMLAKRSNNEKNMG